MRSLLRGIGWGGIIGGIIGQFWGPDDLTFIPHIIVGLALVIAASVRPGKEATDYTSVMLTQAGYGDPDSHLPAGINDPLRSKSYPRFAFLVFLVVIALVLWPAKNFFVDEAKERLHITSYSDPTFTSGTPLDDPVADPDASQEPAIEIATRPGFLAKDLLKPAVYLLASSTGTDEFKSIHFRVDTVSAEPFFNSPGPDPIDFAYVTDPAASAAGPTDASNLAVNVSNSGGRVYRPVIDASKINFDVLSDAMDQGLDGFAARTAAAPTDFVAIVRPDESSDPTSEEPSYYISVSGGDISYAASFNAAGEKIFES